MMIGTMKMKAGKKKAGQSELADEDSCWKAVVRRDPAADFYYSVDSTGVFCRPSCPARLARRRNVQFHASIADAQRAGFRPCKRCKPDQPRLVERHTAIIARVCRVIETAQDEPSLDTLARSAGLSRYYFHRIFKTMTGITPKAYAAAHRDGRIRQQLQRTKTVTRAVYDAGFNSSARFYASASDRLGMAPSQFRRGAPNTRIRFAIGECSLGAVLVAATDKGVCSIMLGDEPGILLRNLEDRFAKAEFVGPDRAFGHWVAKVVAFVESPTLGLDLPLDIRGTVFQQRVWQALRKIPFGSTASYSDIARQIGSPKAVRAVARACGANPVALAVPCHRVIRTDGALCGYRWGVERKRVLLDRESGSLQPEKPETRNQKPETRNQKSE